MAQQTTPTQVPVAGTGIDAAQVQTTPPLSPTNPFVTTPSIVARQVISVGNPNTPDVAQVTAAGASLLVDDGDPIMGAKVSMQMLRVLSRILGELEVLNQNVASMVTNPILSSERSEIIQ